MKILWRVLVAVLVVALFISVPFLLLHRPRLNGKVDASTPLAQHGFVLVDVQQIGKDGRCPYTGPGATLPSPGFYVGGGDPQNEDTGGVGLWIRQRPGAPNAYGNPPALDIMARSSTGDVFHLPATTYLPGAASGGWFARLFHLFRPAEPLALAHFPGGYPDSYKYMDVTVRDKQGHQARWRLVKLPRSQHRIPPPVTVQDTVHVGNVRITAQAWRNSMPQGVMGGSVDFMLNVKMPEDPQYLWNLPSPQGECEWEPSGYAPAKATYSTGGWFSGTVGMGGMPIPAYYPRYQKFARLHTALQQFAKREEKVTFHDLDIKTVVGKTSVNYVMLAKPRTLTTPSGIALTLPTQGVWPPPRYGQDYDHTPRLRLTLIGPVSQVPTLPASPLFQKYHKLVLLDVWPDEMMGDDGKPLPRNGSSGGDSHHYEVRLDKPQPHLTHLRSLTVTVTQRVLLRETPLQFTLPVSDKQPSGS